MNIAALVGLFVGLSIGFVAILGIELFAPWAKDFREFDRHIDLVTRGLDCNCSRCKR